MLSEGIVNRQPTGERIYREHGRLWGKPKHGLHMRAGGPIAGNLKGGALKETIAKELGRIRQPVWRKFLSTTE